jgi:hypothetical protein
MRVQPLFLIGVLAAAACGAATPHTENPTTTGNDPPPTVTEEKHADAKWKQRPADAACQAGLQALAAGQLDGWKGLGKCGRVDAENTLGSSGDQPSKFEQFGEYRVYPHQGGSILVWFLKEDIRVMQFLFPKLGKPIKGLLGEPEAKTPSRLSEEWDQWVYASRGLTAHVKRANNEVVSIFVYKPTTVEAFLQTDIARISKGEQPLEELK